MKLNLSTIALLTTAILLGGITYITQRTVPPTTEQSSEQPTGERIFSFNEDDITAFTLTTQLRTLSFRKSGDQWQMTQPEQATASSASVAYLLNLLATGTSDRTVTAPSDRRESFGLHQPMATVTLSLENGTSRQLVIGGYTFDRNRLYAQVDPPASGDSLALLLVSTDFDNAVNRPLAEWKEAPPQ